MKERSLEKWGYGNILISVREKAVGTERGRYGNWNLCSGEGVISSTCFQRAKQSPIGAFDHNSPY